MDPQSKVLQKPIYQAISKVWGAGSSFINTVLVISWMVSSAFSMSSSVMLVHIPVISLAPQ